ncbi:MAG: ABC transporter ATP-binding protein [Planctomycetes bacterium]|nr:ABC transporter ATP-binding protein [Planctomycetota bacterium]
MKLHGNGLAVRRGERELLLGVDLRLHAGELVLLVGRNGSGKSTLLRLLLGVEPCDRGSVELDGRPIGAWPARERAQRLAFVPQDPDCPFEFTGRELVAMGRHPLRGSRTLTDEDRAAVDQALTAVDAGEFADRAVTTLSGGERRRIALARALATGAPLQLLDEPTANLDLEHALALAQLLQARSRAGLGVLIATHELNLLAPFADRVVALHAGQVLADGPPETVLSATNVATLFGVDAVTPQGYFPRAFVPRRG